MGSYMALLICILLIILAMQCNARPGAFMPEGEQQVINVAEPHGSTSIPGTFAGLTSHGAFRYMFNFFPKGVPIPPSGPSPGHNSKEDGTDPASSSSEP